MSKLSLTEATMLALQGKLEESKPATHRRSKKQENIDVNVDDKTAVSVIGNETIVDTEKATIIVDKKEDEFVPETSDGIVDDTSLPMEAPDEDVVEVPVDGDETIIPEDKVPVEQDDEDEAVLDAEADVDLPLGDTETEEDDEDDEDDDEEDEEDKEESKKVESKSKKTETLGYHAGQCPDCKSDDLSFEEPNIYEDGMDYPFHCNSCGADGVERYNIDYVESETNELDESKKVEKVNKDNIDINNAIANPQLKANREKIRQAGYETDKKSVTNPRNGRTFQTKYAPNKDKIDWKNRLDKEKTDFTAIVGPESDKIPSSRKIKQRSTLATYSKADADAYGVKYGPERESKKTESVEDVEDIYKSTNLFKALCDEVEDITCEDGEKPSREQIEKAVDIVINGYDYIWEDLHTALRTEIDKITGYNEDTDSFKPRYEAKSKRRSLGKVTEKVIKYSSKTFKEALNKYYTTNTKTIESVDLTKFNAGRNFIKMEVKLTNKDGMVASKILEMKEIAKNKNFTKYAMVENSRIKNESKSNISMLVATNKDKVLECKYIKK